MYRIPTTPDGRNLRSLFDNKYPVVCDAYRRMIPSDFERHGLKYGRDANCSDQLVSSNSCDYDRTPYDTLFFKGDKIIRNGCSSNAIKLYDFKYTSSKKKNYL